MNIRKTKGIKFDDVLLLPKRSSIRSRSEVDSAGVRESGSHDVISR